MKKEEMSLHHSPFLLEILQCVLDAFRGSLRIGHRNEMDTIMIVVKPTKDLPLEFLTMSFKNKNIDMINMIRQFEKGLQKDTERWIMTEGNERLGNRGIKKLEACSKTSGQNKYGTF